MLMQIISAFIATFALSVLNQSPKKHILLTGVVAAAGWAIYLGSGKLGMNNVIGVFLASCVVAFLSHVFARCFKAPVTVYLIAGIIPLVPGAGMYNIVYTIIYAQYIEAEYYFFETIKMAGMIALALFIVDAIFRRNRPCKNKELAKCPIKIN